MDTKRNQNRSEATHKLGPSQGGRQAGREQAGRCRDQEQAEQELLQCTVKGARLLGLGLGFQFEFGYCPGS